MWILKPSTSVLGRALLLAYGSFEFAVSVLPDSIDGTMRSNINVEAAVGLKALRVLSCFQIVRELATTNNENEAVFIGCILVEHPSQMK